jgi:hypothetical protein
MDLFKQIGQTFAFNLGKYWLLDKSNFLGIE